MAIVGTLQIGLELALGKLTSSISTAQKQISAGASQMSKALGAVNANAKFELAKKGIEGVTKAWKFLVEGSETKQFNESIKGVTDAFETVRNAVGESITRSEAFNEALEILSEWLNAAGKSAGGLGTMIGDVLAYALVGVQAPLIVLKGLLAYLNGLLGIWAKGVSLVIAGLRELVTYHPALRAIAEGVKSLGGPDVIAALDGLSGAFADISTGAFEQASIEFEAMKDNATELGANIDRVNAKAGIRSSSRSQSSKVKKEKEKKKDPAWKDLNKPTSNWRDTEAAAALDELATQMAEIQKAAEEAQKQAVENAKEIFSFAGQTISDAVFQPLEDGFLDMEKILDGVKKAVLDVIKQLLVAIAMKSLLGVATGGVGGALATVLGFASGGLVGGQGGPRSDSNLARVSRGEFIMDAATVDHYGAGFFAALQRRRLPAFASGGLVGGGSAVRTAGPGGSVVVNISGAGLDEDALARAVGRALRTAGIRGDSELRAVLPTSSTSLLRRG